MRYVQDHEASQRSLATTMELLQQLVWELDASVLPVHKATRVCKFPASVQVAMHMLLPFLRNQHAVRDILELAMSAMLPGLAMQGLQKRFPSESHIRKRQICFDAALMMWRRDRELAPLLRWVWIDSSPQANRDWLQVKEKSLLVADVAAVATTVEQMACANHAEDPLSLDELHEHNALLEQSFNIHMRIPVAKASGAPRVTKEHPLATVWAQTHIGCVCVLSLRMYVCVSND